MVANTPRPIDVQTIPVLTLPSVPFAARRGLPRCAAIYFVLNAHDTVLYVGRSVNLAARWNGHHQKANLTYHGATRLAWLVMDDAALLPSVEAACVAYFEPVCNGKLDALRHMQIRLESHQVEALDGARVMADPASGLTITLSRQQVLLGILDQWIAAREPQPQAVTDTVTDTEAPQKPPRKRKRQPVAAD